MKRLITHILIAWSISLLFPLIVYAGLDDDLNGNLTNKTNCLKSWQYNKSAFNIYFDANQCKKGEATAALLTVRYIFESNNATFPKNIVIDFGDGTVESYPFSNIPSLTK